jgi:GNAT superfamily N-acetyltransferase
MQLREATTDDIDVLADFWFELASEMEQYSELNELSHDSPETAKDGLKKLLELDSSTVFLLQTEGETIGYLLLNADTHPSREIARYTKVVDLFVKPGYRSRGYGSTAIEAVKQYASENGADYLTVACEWENDGARRFYKDNGFTEKQVTFAQRLD